MFTLATGFYQQYLVPPEVSILIVGLDNSGKTTLLERLKVTDFKNSIASSGKRIVVDKHTYREMDDHQPQSISEHSMNGNGENHDRAREIIPDPPLTPKVDKTNKSHIQSSSRLRGFLSCPAPKSYKQRFDSDEETELVIDSSDNLASTTVSSKNLNDTLNSTSTGNDHSHSNGNGTVSAAATGDMSRTRDNTVADTHGDGLSAGSRVSSPSSPYIDHCWHANTNAVNHLRFETYGNGAGHPGGDERSSSQSLDGKQNDNLVLENGRKSNGGHTDNGLQYDLKEGKNMFPLHLIRPTIGMNLGKIEACGAKVKIMDLGGTMKMRTLWERYYSHVQGIIFVTDVSPTCEVSKLMEARAFYRFMRDDESLGGVPVMIFANKSDDRGMVDNFESNDFSNDSNARVLGDTSLLDIAALFLSPPRGAGGSQIRLFEDENVSMFVGSAKTGEGVRAASEWLIQKGVEKVSRDLEKKGI